MRAAALAGAAILFTAVAASAQSITAEADATAGVSTENVRAGSTQVRLFGATASDWRFLTEIVVRRNDGGGFPTASVAGDALEFDGGTDRDRA